MAEPRGDRALRRPLVAAGLSFIWPGLGQAWQRRRSIALLLAVPAAIVVLVFGLPLAGRLDVAALTLIDPGYAGLLLLAVVILGFWRAFAVWDAWRQGPPGKRSSGAVATLVLLVVGVAVMHGVVGLYAWAFYDAGSKIIIGGDPKPTSGPATPAPGATATPVPSAGPTQLPNDRITILLLGVDSGHAREFANTDTMLVVSVSVSRGTVTMVSFPRDISGFPLYSGGTYRAKLNSLMSAAADDPKRFPDGPGRTLANELGYLLGIPIRYTASMDLVGFEEMINKVGGVDIDNETLIDDPYYDWFDGTFGFTLSPGRHHLDGRHALAYVRSRRGAGDNDFKRAERQQQLLLALRSKFTQPDVIAKVPDLLEIAGRTVSTDLPPDLLRQSVSLAGDISAATVRRVVLGPPYTVHPPTSTTGGIYTLTLLMDRLEALSIELFGAESRYAVDNAPSPSPSP